MIGLDTNVLVRFLVRDDPDQEAKAWAFMQGHCLETDPCLISVVVLCELVWVLGTSYHYRREELLDVIEKILEITCLQVDHPDIVWAALRESRMLGTDLADSLIGRINQRAGCAYTVTFDKRATRLPHFQPI